MNVKKPSPLAWGLLMGSLAVALLGAVWAYFGASGCGSCSRAGELLGGKNLAGAGLLYYSTLFALALALGPSLLVYSGVLVAAGVHAGLVAILIHQGIACPPCILTAVAAGVALGGAIACDPGNTTRATLVAPGAALAIQAWLFLGGVLPTHAESHARLEEVAESDLAQAPVAPGKVKMVVYTRPDCGYCMELERDVLPPLENGLGGRLDVERRRAEELPGIPTPTIILSGAGGRRLFPGLPPTADLRLAIETLMEGRRGH